MSSYYSLYDQWLCPIILEDDQTDIVFEEGGGEATASLTASSQLGDDTTYMPCLSDASYDGSQSVSTVDVVSGRLTVRPLYEEIAKAMTDVSPAGLTYSVAAQTPTGSELTDSGLQITNSGSNDINILWSDPQTTLPPQLFGYDRDRTTDTGASAAIDSPISRWGVWQAPVVAHDERGADSDRTFSTTDHPTAQESWRWTPTVTERTWVYKQTPGVHVWPFDRADKDDQQRIGGLPDGDNNNAIKQVWQLARIGFEPHNFAVIAPGSQGLVVLDTQGDAIEVVKLAGDWSQTFDPVEQGDSQQKNLPYEQYNLQLQTAGLPPSALTGFVIPYRH